MLCELGSVTDVRFFFDCLNVYVVSKHSQQNWSLISDRLYKRYSRLHGLDAALTLMEQVKEEFSVLPSDAIDWRDYEETKGLTNNRPNKRDVKGMDVRDYQGA